jgi:DNA-binding NarL/FixJ family response regulator
MTNTIDQQLLAVRARPVRVELRDPAAVLDQAIPVALAAVGLELLEVGSPGPPDVVVWALDAAMLATGGPALRSGPPVLALVEGLDETDVRRLYTAGVRGVLRQSSEPDVVVTAAMSVANGLAVAQPDLFGPRLAVEPLLLDRDELRWMRALAAGTHMSAIAHREGHSERDMYRKFSRVYAKLRVSGRAEALVVLARADLLRERHP